MKSQFFKTSTTWVLDFRYEGRPRRWYKAFGPGVDVRARMVAELHALHGNRAQLVDVREATDEEEAQYLRGEHLKASFWWFRHLDGDMDFCRCRWPRAPDSGAAQAR